MRPNRSKGPDRACCVPGTGLGARYTTVIDMILVSMSLPTWDTLHVIKMNLSQHGSASWSSSARCSYWGRWKNIVKEGFQDWGLSHGQLYSNHWGCRRCQKGAALDSRVTHLPCMTASLEMRGRCKGKMEDSLSGGREPNWGCERDGNFSLANFPLLF